MDAVLAFDGAYYTDVTADNDPDAGGFQPFGPLAAGRLGAAASASTPKLPFPGGLSCSLAFWPATDRGVPAPSPCGGGARPSTRRRRSSGSTGPGPPGSRSRSCRTTTLAFTLPRVRAGDAAGGRNDRARQPMPGKVDAKRAWLRARLAATFYEQAPTLSLVRRQRGRRARRADRAERGPRRQRRRAETDLHALEHARARRHARTHNRRGQRPATLDRGRRLFRQRPERHGLSARPDHGR